MQVRLLTHTCVCNIALFDVYFYESLLTAYTEKLLHDFRRENGLRLSQKQETVLKEKLIGLYKVIQHPVLMERRLHIGAQRPQVPPDSIPHSVSYTQPSGMQCITIYLLC